MTQDLPTGATSRARGTRQTLAALWGVLTVGGVVGWLSAGLSPNVLGGVAVGSMAALASFHVAVDRAHEKTGVEPVTIATTITVVRAAALALLGGFLVGGVPEGRVGWLAGALFAVAAGGDAVDGAVARASDAVTELGAQLDAEIDGATVLVGTTVAVVSGAAPVAFLLVGVARPLFSFGLRRRRRRGLSTDDLRQSRIRRPLGAATMVVTWLALLPIPGDGVSWMLSAALTVPVTLSFLRDWLVVTGRR